MEHRPMDYIPVTPGKKVKSFILKTGQWVLAPLVGAGNLANALVKGFNFSRFQLTYPIHPRDIFIVTYPKSGTTWMQMILYQLTSDGNMRFGHILQKSPFWEEMMWGGKVPRRLTAPGVFKTHLSYKTMGKYPCKYIYIVRDGKDVAVSYYHHYLNLMGFRGSFNDFFFTIFLKGGYQDCNWFEHVRDWYRNDMGLDILYVKYEDMKTDLRGVINRVMEFCGIQVDEANLRRVVERSGFAFMKTHEDKFDPATEYLYQRGIIPGKFLRKGESGGWQEYFDDIHAREYSALYRRWLEGKADFDYGLKM